MASIARVWLFILAACPAIAEAKPPKLAPKLYIHYRACGDGGMIHDRLSEQNGKLFLTRKDCRDISPMRTDLNVPSGVNVLETDYLIWKDLLFEAAHQMSEKVVIYCRSSNGFAVVKKTTAGLWLGASIDGKWTAVAAVKRGSVFGGHGNMDPKDILSLYVAGATGDLKYNFETGKGRAGARPVTKGSARLNCYRGDE